MNFAIDKKQLNMSGLEIMRKASYAFFRDPKSGEESFVRRLHGEFYPRFHLYLSEERGHLVFNLHLDQKKQSYAGSHKHSADYDGPVVAEETERIKQVILHLLHSQ